MKKLTAFLAALVLCAAVLPAFAADAVSSATLNITELPEIRENPDAKILVFYFSTDDTVKAAARTIADGDVNAYRQMEGDLLYYLSSQRGEAYKDGTAAFVDRFIDVPDIWESREDSLRVLSLGHLLKELSLRTPVGTAVPDLTVRGTLRRHRGLFCKGSREGDFALRKLKGAPGYVVFYSPGCGLCQETLAAVDSLVEENRRARVLLVDMDALEPPMQTRLLDTFDLSSLPFVLELDRKGTIVHRYVQL